MTIIRVSGFGGIVPRLGKRVLPANNAQYALNAQLFSGELRAWQRPRLLATFDMPHPQDIFHYRHPGEEVDHYIPFALPTDVVKAPLTNDAYDRLYWTDGGAMKITTMADVEAGVAAVDAGLPPPLFTVTPAITATGGDPDLSETRVYTFIYVSKYGEEGPPADTYTITADGNNDGTWTITNIDTIVDPGGNVEKLRMYRTITSSAVAFREVVEWPIDAVPASFDDDVPSTTVATNPQLQSLSWTAPPTGLRGLCAGPNGMLAAFKGRTIRFSEPYFPHAWPESYQLAVADDIVAIGWVGSMMVVGTTGRPAFITGTSPTSLALETFGQPMPCLSARSFVATPNQVFFASHDGLLAVSAGGIQCVTNPFCTRREWEAGFSPATLSGAIYQNRYFGFYSSQLGFSLGFDDATTGMTDLQFDGVTIMKSSAVDSSAHLLVGNKLLQWDSTPDSPLLYVWRTKPFLVPKPLNFGVIQLRGDFVPLDDSQEAPPAPTPPDQISGFAINDNAINTIPINGQGMPASTLASDTVSVKLYCDKKLRWVGTIHSEAPVRLPSGFKASEFEIEVSGSISLYSLTVASTAKELEQTP